MSHLIFHIIIFILSQIYLITLFVALAHYAVECLIYHLFLKRRKRSG